MSENRDLVEHIVDVDEYLDIRLKIPKRMDVLEFTALLEKSRKLLKLGEVTINVPVETNSVKQEDIGEKSDGWWTEEYGRSGRKRIAGNLKAFLDEFDASSKVEMARKYGFSSDKALYSMAVRLREKVGGKSKGKYGVVIQDEDAFLKEYEQSDTKQCVDMAKKYGFKTYNGLKCRIHIIRKNKGIKVGIGNGRGN